MSNLKTRVLQKKYNNLSTWWFVIGSMTSLIGIGLLFLHTEGYPTVLYQDTLYGFYMEWSKGSLLRWLGYSMGYAGLMGNAIAFYYSGVGSKYKGKEKTKQAQPQRWERSDTHEDDEEEWLGDFFAH